MTLSVGVLVRYASINALVALGMLVAILAVVPVATVSVNDDYWKVRSIILYVLVVVPFDDC